MAYREIVPHTDSFIRKKSKDVKGDGRAHV